MHTSPGLHQPHADAAAVTQQLHMLQTSSLPFTWLHAPIQEAAAASDSHRGASLSAISRETHASVAAYATCATPGVMHADKLDTVVA